MGGYNLEQLNYACVSVWTETQVGRQWFDKYVIFFRFRIKQNQTTNYTLCFFLDEGTMKVLQLLHLSHTFQWYVTNYINVFSPNEADIVW